ncbi:hypothetical protein MODO_2164 [Myroides odoratimimus]|uniref:Uncharacterized protein n=1 Tax=Myroides odoratimimus CCUG 10230 TaxID=883150 RepID=A0ABN0EA46_9FLAO|nr:MULTISPECIES: hypothetical protein [Myroides]AJA67465.1 hypothetical protein MYRA21_0228 [Myroides sp. A21]EHO09114.1 hypothetical protein HMPREF9712_01895 [Myroides odoratimimus CCUG 10230]MDM1066375.1 hypothetical protein [Myroides odoratimimus]MDM1085771.1 hypothetical protein [Myroides odoratimimus]MDM1457830.1 hypothetical protein [Myroides odoratimimus]
MKKLILSATVAFTVLTTSNIYAQQGFGTNTPDRSSAVDIVSGKRGLLIPRFDIPNLDQGTPVINPANALMVYNIGSKTPAGFYYWDANFKHEGGSKGRWVRFVSSNSGSSVTVSAGDNVTVTPKPDANGHDIDYNVSVKAGTAPNQVLVTKKEGDTFVSEWVNPEVFLKDIVAGTNGVKTEVVKDDKGNVINTVVKLGGDLTEKTVLNTGKDKELAIKGLELLTKDNVAGHNIVVMGSDGILKNVSAKDLVEDAIDKGAINGKALTSTGKSIEIKGDAVATALLKDVNIEVKGGEKAGQVLVTKEITDSEGKVTHVTEWVDASALGNTVKSGQGITVKDDNTVNLGGKIKNDGTTPGAIIDLTDTKGDKAGDIAIKGLEELVGKEATTGNKLDSGSDKLVIADKDGVLKQTSAKNLIEDAVDKGGLTAKTLTTDGKIVIGDNKSTLDKLDNAVLVATQLSIKEGSITSTEILDGTIANVDLGSGAVSADKMTSNTTANGTATPAGEGQIPVADGNGGVTYQQVTGELLNGKALKSESIVVTGGAKALLDETSIEIKGGTTAGQVLVTKEVKDAEGTVTGTTTEWVDASALGNTVTASNGLTKEGNDIQLGGIVDKKTVLAIDNTKGGSLAITGLDSPAKDKTTKVVVVDTDGKLATIDKGVGNVTINKEGDVTIGGNNSVVNNYHPSMEEIVIEVTLGATDTNLSLPAVNGTEGQTISVKIVNADEKHNGYLNIKSGSDVLAYGAMPFQGWIIKSNGTKWIVVGRN